MKLGGEDGVAERGHQEFYPECISAGQHHSESSEALQMIPEENISRSAAISPPVIPDSGNYTFRLSIEWNLRRSGRVFTHNI